jgi:amino acid adenylation domain-containing protein
MSAENRRLAADGFSARRRQLSAAKQALLDRRLQGRQGPDTRPVIRRQPRSGALPVSCAQEQLWFMDRLAPGSASFNIPAVIRLEGPLNTRALQAGLDQVAARHEILRTTFTAIEGRPVQVVAPPAPVPLSVVDLSSLPAAVREQEALRLAAGETARGFDLTVGPLMRIQLLRLSEDHHLLALTMHHIVFDEWSVALFVRELLAVYEAVADGTTPALPELPIQYGDFAAWQRGWLETDARERHLEYWHRELASVPRMLELPTDRPRRAVQTFEGSSASIILSAALVGKLTALARAEDATLFMLLLAGWQVLLHRYTMQEQIVVSTGVASRTHRETESLIGCLTNILVLRGELRSDATFRNVLRQARRVTLGAFSHQDLPFEHLVQELQPERDLSHPPFTQSMLVLLNAPSQSLHVEGLRLTPVSLESTTTQYDLLLHFWEEGAQLCGRLRYSTDLFDRETIVRLLSNFRTLLESAAAEPDRAIGALSIMDAGQLHKLVVEWNETRVPFLQDKCLHELFEARVDLDPAAPAVITNAQTVTYGELESHANRVAARLKERGVGPGSMVGMALRRSLESVAGLLGIAKAGGAYVPLDPGYPGERLALMLQDCGATAVVTDRSLVEHLPIGNRALCLAVDGPPVARETRDSSGARADGLAYLIYTSGSTGRPKGVMLDHRGRVNNFTDFNRRFQIGPGDRLLALSSLGFDMSAYDVFGTLAAGAAIVLPDPADEREPVQWADMIRRHRVTLWHSVPALLQMLVDRLETNREAPLDSLRLVLVGGDWIPVSLPGRLMAVAPGARVVSLGGATEVSMDSTLYTVDTCRPDWESIPYGRPMANQTAHVLDRWSNAVPIGVPGELCLGGVGVAWGYHNRPDLTAEKFVPDPFSVTPGARLYRTGDCAKYMPDGNLELLGRLDQQVKIRGARVEPGEVEARLRQHPLVKSAVVIGREDTPGDQRLVAYVLANSESPSLDTELREFVRDNLPAYMVPAAFVRLDRWPLTPHGKIDRKALPPPAQSATAVHQVLAPRNGVESAIALLWTDVLRVTAIGVNQNFFDLGGHSLLAAQLVARILDVFQVDVPMRALFRSPTVAELSEVVQRLGAERRVDVSGIAAIYLRVNAMSDEDARRQMSAIAVSETTRPATIAASDEVQPATAAHDDESAV